MAKRNSDTAARYIRPDLFKVTQHRGEFIDGVIGPTVAATVHSSILRAPGDDSRRAEMSRFVEDLRGVAKRLQ